MKSCPSYSRKRFSVLLKSLWVLLCLLVLVGCSGGNNQAEVDQSELEIKNDQLITENEKMSTELENASADLEAAEAKIKELENELAAVTEAQAEQSETVQDISDVVIPERSSSELLIGEWFFSEFTIVTEVEAYTESLVFHEDKTGVQLVTYYLPSYLNADNYSTSAPTSELSFEFSWSLDGDTIHTVFGGGDAFVDYRFSAEQQQLLMTNNNGVSPKNENLHVREKPAISEGYVEASIVYGNMDAQMAAYRRKFLGTWYFDLTVWTFNDDGTGLWDIPEWGDQPAVQREFTYSATESMLTIDWVDTGTTAFFWPEINANGSIMLNDDVKLTRQFDPTNCPVSTEIISGAYNAITGQMFSDILGDVVGDAVGDIAGDVLGDAVGELVGNAVEEIIGG